MKTAGGIDLGGTGIKAALVATDGRILGRAQVPTLVEEGAQEVFARLAAALATAEEAAGSRAEVVGVGVPGLVDPGGVIRRFPNFPGWDGLDLRRQLTAALNRPVVIENDANAAAVAEGLAGAAVGRPDYLLATLGTGVGAGLVLGGRLVRGGRGRAGELGHVKVVPGGLPCGCGGRGCVEQYASATALQRQADAAVAAGRLDPPRDGAAPDPRWLAARARQGDPTARELFAGAAAALGTALSAVVNLLDVPVFLLGGGLSGAFDLLEAPLRRALLQDAFGLQAGELELAAAICGNDAGVIGAAHLARCADGPAAQCSPPPLSR